MDRLDKVIDHVNGVVERSRGIIKNAPGPPPRPGLEWKEETKRWIRPDRDSTKPKRSRQEEQPSQKKPKQEDQPSQKKPAQEELEAFKPGSKVLVGNGVSDENIRGQYGEVVASDPERGVLLDIRGEKGWVSGAKLVDSKYMEEDFDSWYDKDTWIEEDVGITYVPRDSDNFHLYGKKAVVVNKKENGEITIAFSDNSTKLVSYKDIQPDFDTKDYGGLRAGSMISVIGPVGDYKAMVLGIKEYEEGVVVHLKDEDGDARVTTLYNIKWEREDGSKVTFSREDVALEQTEDLITDWDEWVVPHKGVGDYYGDGEEYKVIDRYVKDVGRTLKTEHQNMFQGMLDKYPITLYEEGEFDNITLERTMELPDGYKILGYYINKTYTSAEDRVGIKMPTKNHSTVIHELGHQIDNFTDYVYEQVSNEGVREATRDLSRNYNRMRWSDDPNDKFVSSYAKTSMKEYTAEVFREFIMQPNRLKMVDRIAYDILKGKVFQ